MRLYSRVPALYCPLTSWVEAWGVSSLEAHHMALLGGHFLSSGCPGEELLGHGGQMLPENTVLLLVLHQVCMCAS